ncbi:MAG: TonB C-terminal domain-containing protein [Kiritimatiellae bacterium]|nr:TonB C-terminal domain-containing protein [Kiritimatiellia bacterium]
MALADWRVVARSAAVHAALILMVAVSGMVRSCFYRPRRFDSITVYNVPDVALVTPAPPAASPTPSAPPPKVSEDIPEAAPRPKVQVSRVKITRPAPTSPRLAPTAEELKRLLAPSRPLAPSSAGDARSASPPDWYLALVRKVFYDAWDQPGGLRPGPGLRVIAQIRVARDGSILRAEPVRLSGHATLDASVERALRAVTKLPPLPEAFPGAHRDLQIAFELGQE